MLNFLNKRFNKIIDYTSLVVLIFFSANLISQNKGPIFFSNKNYFAVSLGYIFNKPILAINNANIKPLFSADQNLNASWFYFFNKHFGFQMKLDFSTQSTRYATSDSTGNWNIKANHPYSKTGRNSLTTAITYNFLAAKHLNLLVACAPQFHLNRYTNPYDSADYRFNKQNGGLVSHNTRQTGFGIYLGLTISYKITEQVNLFVNPSYQRGFVKIRESKIGTPTNFSILGYYGSGPSIMIGILFCLKTKNSGLGDALNEKEVK